MQHSQKMAPKIERVAEDCVLGEGPHWDQNNQNLYFVDIYGKNLLRYQPTSKELWKVSVAPRQPSFIIPVQDQDDHFVVSLNNELVIIKWNGKDDTFSTIQTLSTVKESTNFNDGKCDSSGRLWAGTVPSTVEEFNKETPGSVLYSYDSEHRLRAQVTKIKASNGLAFDDKNKKMFYIDTMKGTIDRFDFQVKTGAISNREVLFTLKNHNIDGLPDGMAIDTDGNLWVAIFEASRVIKIDGHELETLLDTIEIPAQQVTSVAFGGPDMDELYVTSGCFEYNGRTPLRPANGSLYRITGIGAKGSPVNKFRLD